MANDPVIEAAVAPDDPKAELVDAENVEPSVYSQRYIVFMDILGFSEIVRSSQGDAEQASRLAAILEKTRTRTSDLGVTAFMDADFKSQSFSDCIVLSTNTSADGLTKIAYAASMMAFDLLLNRILVRGGLTKGDLHHSEGAVFGPALLEAYRLESTIARYPRILVGRSVHSDFNKNASVSLIQYAGDGPPFLDIFWLFRERVIGGPNADWLRKETTLEEWGAECQKHIQAMLDEAIYNPQHFEKVRWLAAIWNELAKLWNEHGMTPLDKVSFSTVAR